MPRHRIALLLPALLLVSCVRAPVVAEPSGDKASAASSSESLGRNLANTTDKGITTDFAVKPKGKEKNVKWAAALGTVSYGGPVIAGGKIYIGTNNGKPRDPAVSDERGVLMCFNEADGKFLWQHTYERLEESQDAGSAGGIASSPWVEGDRLWYVNNRAEFVCSDTSGKVIWKYDMIKELDIFVGQHVYTSPLVVGDLVYGLTCNGVEAHKTNKLPKPKAPSLVALNKKTGKLAWTNALPGAGVMRGQWSNPSAALVDGKMQVVYGGGDGWLYGLDAKDGTLIWKFDCNPKKATPYKAGGGGQKSFLIGTPVLVGGRCYVGVGQEPDDGPGVGHLWCIDITKKPKNKDKDLSPAGDDFDPKSKANADSGLVWHYGGAVVPKPKGDEREWVFGRTMGTVAVHDGIVYAAELAGYLHAIDAPTGKKLWEHDFTEDTWCSPYYVDGRVFLGTNGSAVYIFPAGRIKAEPKKVAIGQNVKMPVVVANGVLYINAGSTLYAIKK